MAARADVWVVRGHTARKATESKVSALPGVPAAPYAATGRFRTLGLKIIDPNGREFIPRGMNLGTPNSDGGVFPSPTRQAAFINRMRAQIHPNTVRLVFMTTNHFPYSTKRDDVYGYGGFFGDAAVDKMVDDHINTYLAYPDIAAVMIESHDLTDGSFKAKETGGATPIQDQVVAFNQRAAARWKNNTRVWFNTANEPNLDDTLWSDFQDRCITAIRGEGADNIIVMDAPGYGNDCGKNGSGATIKFSYHSTMVPALVTKFGPDTGLVLAQHNYGGFGVWDGDAKWLNYVTNQRGSGIPLMIGEIGWNQVQSFSAFDIQNRDGARAVMRQAVGVGVGALWWADAFNDFFKMRVGTNDGTDTAKPLSAGGVEFQDYMRAAYDEAMGRGAL